MFSCCCDPACLLFEDDFSNDRLFSGYDQLSGEWTVNEAGGYLTTSDAGALLRLKAEPDAANSILFADVRAMSDGDVVTLAICGTEDGSAYLYARISITGDCGETVIGSTGGGESRVIHIGRNSGGYKQFFVAYDEQGWFHFGERSGGTYHPIEAHTIHAMQLAAPGTRAFLKVESAGAGGVRFDNLVLGNHTFAVDDPYVDPTGGCFAHVVPCGYGGADADPSDPITWFDSGDLLPCSALVLSGNFIDQGNPAISASFIGAYRSDGDGKVVNGYPVLYGGDQMTARVSIWTDTGASGKVRLYVDCDATGAGGPYCEVNIPASGPATIQLFDSGGGELTGAVQLWVNLGLDPPSGIEVISGPTGFGGSLGGILTVTRDGDQLRAEVDGSNVIAAYHQGWSNGGYVAAETVNVSGNLAINYPGIWADTAEPHPTLRPADTICHGVSDPNCDTCTSDGTTIRTITVTLGEFTPGLPPPAEQDDDGCCAQIEGTYALSVNDRANFAFPGDNSGSAWCRWEKVTAWCYGDLGPGVSGATLTIRVAMSTTKIYVIVSLVVAVIGVGNATTALTYSDTLGGNPRENCDQASTLTLESSSVGPFASWALCDQWPSSIEVELST
jgi:hypothetical protein